MMRYRVIALCLPMAALLTACGNGAETEIRQWMEQTKRETKVFIKPLAAPKTFAPFVYSQKDSIDPFDPAKLAVALAKLRAQSGKGVKPDLERRREPLEQYSLDTIKMVGTLQKPGMTYAILQVDKLVFQAKVGNYLGQNFGMITGITEDSVNIKEIVQDASGEWTERQAKLELQESQK
ncbi:MAG: pilus assembly protein PilP [Burkholderiaceae bacterium]|nr:pilus assembly protein PilP [Burkholderiaceae bacterium]